MDRLRGCLLVCFDHRNLITKKCMMHLCFRDYCGNRFGDLFVRLKDCANASSYSSYCLFHEVIGVEGGHPISSLISRAGSRIVAFRNDPMQGRL